MTNFGPERSTAERLREALSGTYTIEGEIGRGGMGVVYRARDEQLQRTVAIKVLPPELAFQADIRERFAREARTAARLSHPHIVPIYAVGEASGLVYFCMGLIDGESLAARIRRRGRLPIEEARRIMMEAADALSAAHALAIIHRDIKPDNILLDGPRCRVMVTDFGIAKALSSVSGSTLTSAGIAIGTPSYMSPEQAAGDPNLDGRSDVYSLGVVTYQMLTGQLPFTAPTVAGILMKQVSEPAPDVRTLRPEVPDDLALAIARCLEKNPERRWPTADALRRTLETRDVGTYRPTARTAARPESPRRPDAFSSRTDRQPGRGVERARERHAARQDRESRRHARPYERDRSDEMRAIDTGEPKVVQQARADFARWAAISLGCAGINIATGLHTLWFLVPTFAMSFRVFKSYAVLWQSGYSWRDVLKRPPAPDAVEAANVGRGQPARPLQQASIPSAEEFGAQLPAVLQAHDDRQAIFKLLEKLPPAEQNMLPEIRETTEALHRRALELARTLHAMDLNLDPRDMGRIEERLAAVQKEPEDAERDRRLDLLRRQQQAFTELQTRRSQASSHLENCVLALQNVRFDMLRLRSSGINAVLGDLTQATQQAKALSRDVDYAIAAAREVREAIRG